MGDSRKYPYHTTAVFLEFQGQRGVGPLNWKSESMEGLLLYDWNFKGIRGGGGVVVRLDLEFPQGTDKRLYLENAYFMDFKITSQIKHELATLLTTAEEGYKTSIHQSVMLSCSFVEVNQQNMGCTTISKSHNATKHLFFSCDSNSLINCFAH